MAALMVAAAFQDIEEPVEICARIGIGVNQRMPNARLGGEMDDERKAMLGEQRRGGGTVRQIQPNKLEILGAGELPQPRLLELRVVVRREIVNADNVTAGLHQTARDVKTDEAGGAGDENGIYSCHGTMPSGFCLPPSLDFTPITARLLQSCLLYTSPSPRDGLLSRMP